MQIHSKQRDKDTIQIEGYKISIDYISDSWNNQDICF